MPWRETCVMNEKVKLIEDWLSRRWNKSQLGMKYGISRPTVDKWINRFRINGYSGLDENFIVNHLSFYQCRGWVYNHNILAIAKLAVQNISR